MAKRQQPDLSLVHTNVLLKELMSCFDLGITTRAIEATEQ